MEDLRLSFDNPTKRDEARTQFTTLYKKSGERTSEFVTKARKLNLLAQFSTNQVWEYMWSGLKEEIQDYLIREKISKGKWDPPLSLQACFTIIHDAGLRVEERARNKILAQKHKEALVSLGKSKGGHDNSGADKGHSSKTSKYSNTCKILNFTNYKLEPRAFGQKQRNNPGSTTSKKSRKSSSGGISSK